MSDPDAYAAGVNDTLGIVEQLATTAPAALVLAARGNVSMRDLAHALGRIDPAVLHVLRPFDQAEAIGPKQAASIAGRSESCIRAWVDRFAVGRRVVGSLCISRPALMMLLDDDPVALARYLSGDRVGPSVTPYFARAGFAPMKS